MIQTKETALFKKDAIASKLNSIESGLSGKADSTAAILKSQTIFYRSASATRPSAPSGNNSWVTRDDDVTGAWTRRHLKISPNKNNAAQNYVYIWTCTQDMPVQGNPFCSGVALDESITVIQGGSIVTGSITANQLAAGAVTADKIKTGEITIGIVSGLQSALDNKATVAQNTEAAKTASRYITHVSDAGIRIHPSSTTANATLINSDGVTIYQGNSDVSFFGSTVRIGKAGSSRIEIKAGSISLYDNTGLPRLFADGNGIRLGVLAENQYNIHASGDSVRIRNNSTVLAEYSSTIRLGQSGSKNMFIDSNGVHIYDGNYELGYFGSHARIGRNDIAYTLMNSDGVSLWKYNGSQAVCISSFTQNGANIGQNNDIYVNIASTGFKIYDRSLSENAIVFSAGSSTSSPYVEIGRPVSNTGIRLRLSDEAINFHKSSKTATYGIEVNPGDGTTYLTASTNFKTAGRFVSPYTYSNQSSSTTAANLYISSDGRIFRRSSSSERYKKDISDLNEESFAPELLYDLPVRQFAYKGTDKLIPGFIAEEVEKQYPVATIYENGQVEDWSERLIIPSMLALIQKLNNRVTKLERSQ